VHLEVDVRDASGARINGLPSTRLARRHPFAPGHFVVGGFWVGHIESIRHDVTIAFDDGTVVKVGRNYNTTLAENETEKEHKRWHRAPPSATGHVVVGGAWVSRIESIGHDVPIAFDDGIAAKGELCAAKLEGSISSLMKVRLRRAH